MVNRIIGWGLFSFRYIYPILASLTYIVRSISDDLDNSKQYKINPLFLTLTMFLSETLVGFIVLYAYISSKNRAKMSKEEEAFLKLKMGRITIIQNESLSLHWPVLMILCITIIEGVCFYGLQSVRKHFPNGENIQIEIRALKLIFDSLLCYWVFSYQIHRHHIVSMILLIIGIIMYTIQDAGREFAKFQYFLFFIFILHSLLLSLRDCWEKWIIENKFLSAVTLLFIKGIYGSVLSFIIGVIVYYLGGENIFEIFQEVFSDISVIFYLMFFIFSTLHNLFYALTKEYYSPTHVAVSDSFSIMVIMIIDQIQNQNSSALSWSLITIGSILVMFGCFLYNELIIVYLCGLEMETRKAIESRATLENIGQNHSALIID